MNVVNYGINYQIYGEDVKTFKRLPIMSYEVAFNKNTGFFLINRPDLITNEEKIYGSHERRANKVMESFKLSDRNFGLILSGRKGAGKSLFARMLAQKSIEVGMPVILVNNYISGLEDFLGSIEQETVIIFDEFEKNFAKPNREESFDPQEKMLSLFDGMNNGKKLFVITCNKTNSLNEYFVNRPGRFHYHFKVSAPTEEEVREYMTDKLDEKYHSLIDKVVNFSYTAVLTYDSLRAIAFELNQGYDFDEVIEDLNINHTEVLTFDAVIIAVNGETYYAYGIELDITNRDMNWYGAYTKDHKYIRFGMNTSNLRFTNGNIFVDGADAQIIIDEDEFWEFDGEERRQKIEEAKRDRKIDHILLRRTEVYVKNNYNCFSF